jgi:hypothetical protein
MLYADHYELVTDAEGREVRRKHPLIACQKGALRDDFDFGSVLVFRTTSFRRAVRAMEQDWQWGALYDLRLRMKNIVHINEYLYTEIETDTRKSGEKQFDYVDPKNRAVQIEMEKICTGHLKRIGAWLEPVFKNPDLREFGQQEFPVTASVVIPVFNRIKTVKDAVESALSQECDFPFNVIVVDNHSTDRTGELIDSFDDERVVHIVPQCDDLGIGGCWELAVNDSRCGRFAVQLDSDDIYSGNGTLQRIVDEFYVQQCAMITTKPVSVQITIVSRNTPKDAITPCSHGCFASAAAADIVIVP